MVSKLILLIFPVLLVVLPMLLYKNSSPTMMGVWLRMAYNTNGRKMAANILTLVIIFLHMTYYAAYPADMGIMLSTISVFVLLSTKRGVRLLQWLRNHRNFLLIGMALCMPICVVPGLFPSALSIAFNMEAACFFPADGLENFYEEHVGKADVDKQFVDAYFK